MKNLNRCLAFAAVIMTSLTFNAQSYWNDVVEPQRSPDEKLINPETYRSVQLDVEMLKSILDEAPLQSVTRAKNSSHIIYLPCPDGSTQAFSFVEAPVMEEALAKKFPDIKTYVGQGVDDKTATLRFDLTPKGFHAQVITASGTFYIDPLTFSDTEYYMSYSKRAFYATTDKIFEELPPIVTDMEVDIQKYDNNTETKYKKPKHVYAQHKSVGVWPPWLS